MTVVPPEIIEADWPAPANIRACSTTRIGGVSEGDFAGLNLATHVNDHNEHVSSNRRRLRETLDLPAEPLWLEQVHGTRVIHAGVDSDRVADAAWTDRAGIVCAVLTADCLPVLLCDRAGRRVGIAHAGWRGLLAGVISATLEAMAVPADELMVWLGPAIGPKAFEVGNEVVEAFIARLPGNAAAFSRTDASHSLCDVYRLARLELAQAGVTRVYGGGLCTYSDARRFYSYRRQATTGRIASLIWMSGKPATDA